ncbi:MAG: YbaK/EbsC family protein [Rhodobacteraceae bacterium]|nr:YbaK/EbsC family protein [Paracoccaceae bacterium]
MSKSLKRVRAALEALNLDTEIVEVGQARTAAEAAESLGCTVAQIANSIILLGMETGQVRLFLTSGAERVDLDKAGVVAGEALGKADAAIIRAQTGFAIGGVAPVGHLNPISAWVDLSLLTHDQIFAAAGTPRHLFGLTPGQLVEIAHGEVADFTV